MAGQKPNAISPAATLSGPGEEGLAAAWTARTAREWQSTGGSFLGVPVLMRAQINPEM